jgi:hypothetical protein
MPDKQIVLLNNLLSQIEKHIPFKEQANTTITKTNVGWQLDHTLKVINRVCTILEKTKPSKYKKDFNIPRTILFNVGWLPRGRAKAPEQVIPPAIILEEKLFSQLKTAKTHLESIKLVDDKAFFIHHIFGNLSKAKTIRFLEIHTKHHLKIVRDILKK